MFDTSQKYLRMPRACIHIIQVSFLQQGYTLQEVIVDKMQKQQVPLVNEPEMNMNN